jgi:RecA-family ATPase
MPIAPEDLDGYFADDEAEEAAERRAIEEESTPAVNGTHYPRATQEQRERAAVTTARHSAWANLVTPVTSDWLSIAPPKREWLLRDSRTPNCAGVLPLGKAGQLIGEGGGSKTMAMIQLAISIATGTPWLDTFSVPEAGPVLLVLGEEDAEEVQRRIYSATRRLRAALPAGAIVTVPLAGHPCALIERSRDGNGAETEFLRWLRSFIASSPWKLIVLDPLSRFAGPDAEKDNAQATRFVQAVESLATASGATVLTTHHTNQPSRAPGARLDGTSGRGSTALVDGFRWSAGLKVHVSELAGDEARVHLRKTVELTHNKSNYSQEFEPVMLRRDLDNGGVLVPLDAADVELLTKANDGSVKRAERTAAQRAEQSEREGEEDRAVLDAVRAKPGIPLGDLRMAVKALARCSSERADVAIVRVSAFLDIREGARKAKLHFPPVDASAVPTHLRTSLVAAT